jgi:hypothetical protein
MPTLRDGQPGRSEVLRLVWSNTRLRVADEHHEVSGANFSADPSSASIRGNSGCQ